MALHLTRKRGEKIIIGLPPHRIVIEVEDIEKHRVRLSVEAARDVPVFREELIVPNAETPCDK